jgi:hypothetical protein
MNPASDRPGYRQAADKPAVQVQAADIQAGQVLTLTADKDEALPVVQAEAEQVSLEPAEQAVRTAQPEAVLRSSHKI